MHNIMAVSILNGLAVHHVNELSLHFDSADKQVYDWEFRHVDIYVGMTNGFRLSLQLHSS